MINITPVEKIKAAKQWRAEHGLSLKKCQAEVENMTPADIHSIAKNYDARQCIKARKKNERTTKG